MTPIHASQYKHIFAPEIKPTEGNPAGLAAALEAIQNARLPSPHAPSPLAPSPLSPSGVLAESTHKKAKHE